MRRASEFFRRLFRRPPAEASPAVTGALTRPLTAAARFALVSVVKYAHAGGFRRLSEVLADLGPGALPRAAWERNTRHAAKQHEAEVMAALRQAEAAGCTLSELRRCLRRLFLCDALALERQRGAAEWARYEELYWQQQ